jgi:hypothetical protein
MPHEALAGPTTLARGKISEDLLRAACRITCRYCDLHGKAEEKIMYRKLPSPDTQYMQVEPLADEELAKIRL